MRKVPLLDLGNVVVQVDFAPFFSWLADRSGREIGQVSQLVHSSLFFDFEAGQIRRQEFAQRISRLYGADFSQAELEERFCGIFPGLVDGIEPLLEELASEGPVFCLSNTNELHLASLRERYRCLDRFSRLFVSHELGVRKPYPGIYLDVARDLGLRPGELVFFDDSHANVEGALRAGLEAYVFQGVNQMGRVLKEIGKLDDSA
jgi:glucose-1-phosphatase